VAPLPRRRWLDPVVKPLANRPHVGLMIMLSLMPDADTHGSCSRWSSFSGRAPLVAVLTRVGKDASKKTCFTYVLRRTEGVVVLRHHKRERVRLADRGAPVLAVPMEIVSRGRVLGPVRNGSPTSARSTISMVNPPCSTACRANRPPRFRPIRPDRRGAHPDVHAQAHDTRNQVNTTSAGRRLGDEPPSFRPPIWSTGPRRAAGRPNIGLSVAG
jgi:hypothetical protein